MMKKLYKIFLIGTMSLMLAACGNDKTNDDAISVEEEAEEEVVAEETEEEAVTEEEPVTEEVAVEEETKTTEYQLTQMNSGFYGGIAWATITGDTGAKKVLINNDLQVVYELPEGKEAGDIFDGKTVVINSNQASNPGFMILGADGTVLYECADNLTGNSFDHHYNVNFTRDGSTIYEKKESGLTANTAYTCILNDKFETVAQIEIPDYSEYGDIIDEWRFYLYLSDGVYCCYDDITLPGIGGGASYSDYLGNNIGHQVWFILNAKEHNTVALERENVYIVQDMDRHAGFQLFNEYNGNDESWTAINAEDLDYSGITDAETLRNLAATNGKMYQYRSGAGGVNYTFNHDFIAYTEKEQYGGIENIEGVDLPDFGAEITSFRLSNDGKYIALQFEGADGNYYYTVIGSDGQKLYEPVAADRFAFWGVCDGYILDVDGKGITPDGTVFQLGDGTALSGIGENSLVYFSSSSGSREYILSNGYVVWESKLYQSDGTEVTTVTAVN